MWGLEGRLYLSKAPRDKENESFITEDFQKGKDEEWKRNSAKMVSPLWKLKQYHMSKSETSRSAGQSRGRKEVETRHDCAADERALWLPLTIG